MNVIRRTGTLLRGILAGAVLIVFVLGVPAALVVTVGNPLPEGWTWGAPLTNSALLGILACVAWVFWAQLLVCVGVESVAEVRLATGRSADWLARVPGTFGAQQALARTLVQAVVAVGATTTAVSVIATPWIPHADAAPSSPTPAAHPASAAVPTAAQAQHTQAKHLSRPTTEVVVARGDSLWSIAERHLGGGERWREIAELNRNREMVNGSTFDDARTIEPGWVLRVPVPVELPGGSDTVIVERGDSLWEIAEEQYGDGEEWPRIYSANRDKIDDPHWIYPGQEFHIPGSKVIAAEEPEEQPETPPSVHVPPAHMEPPADSGEPEVTLSEEPPPTSEAETSASPADSANDGWHIDGATVARALLGGGGFLGAGALTMYVARRRTQSRNRRSGRVAPSVTAELRAEDKAVRSIGRTALAPAAFFDAALRELAQRAEGQGSALPETIAARIGDDRLALHLAVASFDAPDPWTVSNDGTTWTLPRSHEPSAGERMSPYPTMVTLGDDASGGTLFIDLEGAGVAQVVGARDAGADLVRFIAAELAINPWTDTEGVSIVGVARDAVPLNHGRLYAQPSLDIEQLVKQVRQMRENLSVSGRGVLSSRVTKGQDAWAPTVMIADVEATDSVRSQVDELLDEIDRVEGRTSVTFLALSPQPVTARGVVLRIESNGALQTPWGEVMANRLTSAEAATLGDLFEDADRDGDEPIPTLEGNDGEELVNAAGALADEHIEERCTTGDPYSLLPKPDHVYVEAASTTEEDLAVLAPAVPPSEAAEKLAKDPELDADLAEWQLADSSRPRLRVLGPVELHAAGDKTKEVESRPAYFAELAAYLNCHPNGLTPNQFAADFGIQNNTLHTRLGQLRKWLSTKPDGEEWYLPNAQWVRGQKVYRLDGILADDDLFRRLRARAQAKGPEGVEDLRKALSLVEGPPYDQQRAKGYGWLVDTPHDHYLTAAIVDVAHIVATHALVEDDPNLALWAAEKAILAAPSEDKPRLDLAKAMKAIGRVDEADVYLDKQVFNRTDDDRPPLDPSDRTKEVTHRHFRG